MLQSTFFSKIYLWTFSGLLLSGVIAGWVASNKTLVLRFYTSPALLSMIFIAELILVVYLSSRIESLSKGKATSMYLIYSALNGLLLSSIFITYEIGTISAAFFISGGMFLVMSLLGFIVKSDLSSSANMIFMGLIGILIAMIANWFFQSSRLDFLISVIAVIIFTFLTVYDTQRLKGFYFQAREDNEALNKMSILGALSLYLNFINIFLTMLRLLGRR